MIINKKIGLGTILLMLLCAEYGHASEIAEQDTTKISLKFQFNSALLLSDYKDNSHQLQKLKAVVGDTVILSKCSGIHITGISSPDGTNRNNASLSQNRATSVQSYLLWKYPHLKSLPTVTDYHVLSWPEVIQLIENDKQTPNREQVLSILRSNKDDLTKTTRLRALSKETYAYLEEHIFSNYREGITCVLQYKSNTNADSIKTDSVSVQFVDKPIRIEEQTAVENESPTVADTLLHSSPSEVEQPKKRKVPFIAIKTNLVQWIGLTPAFDGLHAITPNLGVELYFANRWSVEASYSYSNWNSITGDKCLWAVSQGSIEPRYWLKNNATFRGFYLGAYGNYGSYDTQAPTTGHTGTYYGVGITAGYLQELSKHWAIELGVRGGYRSAANDFYNIELGHYYHQTSTMNNQFVPQVELSIVYRIGRKSNESNGAKR